MTSSTDSPREDRRALPRLHVVTDTAVLRRHDFGEVVAGLLESGGKRVALHVRGPGLAGRELWERARVCAGAAARSGAWLFVNDRLDVALACESDGVQLGRSSFDIPTARRVVGPGPVIGASVHDAASARRAAGQGADLLLVGTLFQSLTHPGTAPTGTAWIASLRDIAIPVIGIGGIRPDRVAEVRRAGGYGVAVIRGIWEADRPLAALDEYFAALE